VQELREDEPFSFEYIEVFVEICRTGRVYSNEDKQPESDYKCRQLFCTLSACSVQISGDITCGGAASVTRVRYRPIYRFLKSFVFISLWIQLGAEERRQNIIIKVIFLLADDSSSGSCRYEVELEKLQPWRFEAFNIRVVNDGLKQMNSRACRQNLIEPA